ncbi:MAG: trimeric intracellular cation channel family protein [Halofilum sp. (in: g-proteobacteria)]
MTDTVYWLDLAGVAVFALSGVIVACRSRMDPFGMLVLAAVTGIGGGTLRDLVLGVRPVFWITDTTYLWVVLATVVLASVGFRYVHRIARTVLPVVDAVGLALFTAIGAHKAVLLDAPGSVAIVMGLFTGVAGGVIRDVLANRVPMVLREEIYATASIAGGITFVSLHALDAPFTTAINTTVVVTLGLRLAAIRWKLRLPVFAWVGWPTGREPSDEDDETLNDR